MNSTELLTIGSLHVDYIITHENRAYTHVVGGSAVHSAAGARIWSESVGILGRVGNDYPEELIDQLRRARIAVNEIKVLPYSQNARAFHAYTAPRELADSKPASHFLRIGEQLPKELVDWSEPEELYPHPQDLSSSHAYVHMAQAGYEIHSAFMIRLRELDARIICLDPSDEYMQPGHFSKLEVLLNDLDALITSEEQLRTLFQPSPPGIHEMVERLSEMGCPVIILRKEPLGLYVWDQNHSSLWQIPTYPARVLDTTGETDAFSGGFLSGFAYTGDPLRAALQGSVSASLSIEGIGALYPLDCAPGLASARLDVLQESAKRI
jgi:sugar/nucleoside kinase (ribokinase family)